MDIIKWGFNLLFIGLIGLTIWIIVICFMLKGVLIGWLSLFVAMIVWGIILLGLAALADI